MILRPWARFLCVALAILIGTAPMGCRNPAQSNLPPSAVAPPGTSLPPLPKGDVYADETVVPPETPIAEGDTLEILVRRGAGEEKFTSVVTRGGWVNVSFVEVQVAGLTMVQAERRIRDRLAPFMRNPQVQALLIKKILTVKRVFVFGDVKKPGVYPLSRNMTVLQAIANAENYNETAHLDEIRVIRGNLNQPQIYTADLARLFTYGDWSRNLSLQENDIVYVPRERLGDAGEAAKKILPIVSIALAPLYGAGIFAVFTQQ